MMAAAPELHVTVPAAPAAAGQARRALRGHRLVDAEQEPTLLLLVSELVTNSVRHAGIAEGDTIELHACAGEDCARVEVCDAGRSGHLPGKRELHYDTLEPGGFGLVLMDEMADRWGVSRHDGETCVWFELACGHN